MNFISIVVVVISELMRNLLSCESKERTFRALSFLYCWNHFIDEKSLKGSKLSKML